MFDHVDILKQNLALRIEEIGRRLAAVSDRPLLPYAFVLIEGGNHTNFGLYEQQDGDGVATIPAEEQQAQTVAATLELLEAVEAAGA